MLIVFNNRSSSPGIPRENGYMVSELRVRSGSIAPSQLEVSVRTECDQYPTTRTQTTRVSYISTDPRGHFKAHEVNLDVDVERSPEK
jgi:hypothetical protein